MLERVVPVEDLDGVGQQLLGEAPVPDGTVAEPEDGVDFLGALDAQRVLEDGREFAQAVDDGDAARCRGRGAASRRRGDR